MSKSERRWGKFHGQQFNSNEIMWKFVLMFRTVSLSRIRPFFATAATDCIFERERETL